MKKKNSFVEWIENLWFYHKFIIIIAVLILLASGYAAIQRANRIEPDYHIAIVSPTPVSDEKINALCTVIAERGTDSNGDGIVNCAVNQYNVNIGSEAMDMNSIQAVGALDADLVGRVSGLYLLANPEAFQKATGALSGKAAAIAELSSLRGMGLDGLFLAIPTEHPQESIYIALLDSLKAG